MPHAKRSTKKIHFQKKKSAKICHPDSYRERETKKLQNSHSTIL